MTSDKNKRWENALRITANCHEKTAKEIEKILGVILPDASPEGLCDYVNRWCGLGVVKYNLNSLDDLRIIVSAEDLADFWLRLINEMQNVVMRKIKEEGLLLRRVEVLKCFPKESRLVIKNYWSDVSKYANE